MCGDAPLAHHEHHPEIYKMCVPSMSMGTYYRVALNKFVKYKFFTAINRSEA
jgi:hypothetical protein